LKFFEKKGENAGERAPCAMQALQRGYAPQETAYDSSVKIRQSLRSGLRHFSPASLAGGSPKRVLRLG
jgi:hypothetical protein